MKIGTKIKTPDGHGTIAKQIGKPPKDGQVLVTLKSNKYWPHWNIYYNKEEIEIIK